MSTPVCIANAVADALGIDAIDLPLKPAKLAAYLHGPESKQSSRNGSFRRRPRAVVYTGVAPPMCRPRRNPCGEHCSTRRRSNSLFPAVIHSRNCRDTHFRADVTLGVGPVSGRYKANSHARGDTDRHRHRRARRRARFGSHQARAV